MNPGLHRSLIFWSGILVMAFIGWAWWNSSYHLNTFRSGAWTVFHAESALVASFNPKNHHKLSVHHEELLIRHVVEEALPLPLIGRGRRLSAAHPPPLEEKQRTLRENWLHYLRFQPAEEWVFLIPHWIMIIAVAVPWSGFLVWRTMRRKQGSLRSA